MVLYSKNIPIPENIPQSEIYESNTWWKAKKWSVFICYEIISQRPDTVEEGEFMKAFQNQLAVPILETILKELTKIEGGQGYLPPRVISNSIRYLGKWYVINRYFQFIIKLCKLILLIIIKNSVLSGTTYKALKPNIQPFLQNILFPILYFNEADQEIWDSDPDEFIRLEHGN